MRDFTKEAKELLKRSYDQLIKTTEFCKRSYENYTYLEPLRSEIEQFLKELEIREDRLCEHCDEYKSFPDGKRCRTCDNGSKWNRQKTF